MITRTWAWPYDPYQSTLPPPLCFTVPAGSKVMTSKRLRTGGAGINVTLRYPRIMMDPSDPTTWQRTYRFT